MKRIVSFLLISAFVTIGVSFDTDAAEIPSLSASAYILYSPYNEEVILSDNAHTRMGMASTTKIMTALLAYEKAEISDVSVKFTEEMTAEGSSMYLKAGDTLRLSDLAAGMMAASGNDGANAIALTIGGSFEGFAKMMNQRAYEIGMKNTNFVTPSGLSDDNHYSTVYDMALLMSSAVEREDFSAMTKKRSVTVDFISPEGYSATYQNHNRLLSLYEYCTGGKTGYTIRDGRCLVSSAERDGLRLIAVTFNDRNDWQDHKALYEYGFERFTAVSRDDLIEDYAIDVLGGEKDLVSLVCEEDYNIVIPRENSENIRAEVVISETVFAPVKKGEVLGSLTVLNGDTPIFETKLCAEADVQGANDKLNLFLFFRNLIYRIFN
ncbi:MAG: D-alanyl-D-alanine carboxypeptidase [Ruminococcus sp.]|nr:D-alanyl-D-alanine carboxypeptidase [Ruminococcus sp.]